MGGGEADLPGGGSGGAADELRTSSRIAAALAPGRVKDKVQGEGSRGKRSAGRVVWSDSIGERDGPRAFTAPALPGDGGASCYRGLAPLVSRSVPRGGCADQGNWAFGLPPSRSSARAWARICGWATV